MFPISPQDVAQFFVGSSLGFGGNRRHDEDSVDKFVARTIVRILIGQIEFFGCHEHAGHVGVQHDFGIRRGHDH